MKTVLLLSVLSLLPACLTAQEISTAAMRQITMPETYTLALARSEALAQQGEYIAQLAAAEKLINFPSRPTLDLNASQTKQQNATAASKGYLSGSYSIFSGMRDYIAAKAASARTGAAKLDLDRARQQLYLDAAQAYIGLLAAQRELTIRREQMDVTGRRITELEAREDLGRSRKSEVVAAKTQLTQDKASYLDAAGAERLAQQALKFLTGLDTDLAPAEIPLREQGDPEAYLKAALTRPDIAARRKTLESAGYLADVQEHNLWPTLAAYGNYYPLRTPAPDPADCWDAGLTLNLPLYTGGVAGAQREVARAGQRSAALALGLAERAALSEVRSAYDELHYLALEEASLKEALSLAQENARLQQEDYKLGLVTNLDVLSALNTVQQTRLALSQARAMENVALLKLEIAAGLEAK